MIQCFWLLFEFFSSNEIVKFRLIKFKFFAELTILFPYIFREVKSYIELPKLNVRLRYFLTVVVKHLFKLT
jgi:hypothetical protein